MINSFNPTPFVPSMEGVTKFQGASIVTDRPGQITITFPKSRGFGWTEIVSFDAGNCRVHLNGDVQLKSGVRMNETDFSKVVDPDPIERAKRSMIRSMMLGDSISHGVYERASKIMSAIEANRKPANNLCAEVVAEVEPRTLRVPTTDGAVGIRVLTKNDVNALKDSVVARKTPRFILNADCSTWRFVAGAVGHAAGAPISIPSFLHGAETVHMNGVLLEHGREFVIDRASNTIHFFDGLPPGTFLKLTPNAPASYRPEPAVDVAKPLPFPLDSNEQIHIRKLVCGKSEVRIEFEFRPCIVKAVQTATVAALAKCLIPAHQLIIRDDYGRYVVTVTFQSAQETVKYVAMPYPHSWTLTKPATGAVREDADGTRWMWAGGSWNKLKKQNTEAVTVGTMRYALDGTKEVWDGCAWTPCIASPVGLGQADFTFKTPETGRISSAVTPEGMTQLVRCSGTTVSMVRNALVTAFVNVPADAAFNVTTTATGYSVTPPASWDLTKCSDSNL